jgi:hypothetical protein
MLPYTKVIAGASTNVTTPTSGELDQGNNQLTPYNSAINNGYYRQMSQGIFNLSAEVENVIEEAGLTPDSSLTQLLEGLDILYPRATTVQPINNYLTNYSTYSPSFRNVLINGAMQIDQRNSGASQTITAGAALAYTIDRWYAYCTGANVAGQQVAGTTPNSNNYRFTGAASVTKIGFAQRIEAANSQFLANNTATFSVDLANSLLTTVTWVAYYANTTNTFGSLASPTKTQIATGTFTVTSTLTRYSTNISIPLAATTGIEIELSVGAQTSGTWTIGRAQLEFGSNATPFEYRPNQYNLALCQGYFERVGGQTANELVNAANCSASTNANTVVLYKVPKRAVPTISFSATNKFRFNNATNNYTSSAVAATSVTTISFLMSLTIAGATANSAGNVDTVDTTGTISISAEL